MKIGLNGKINKNYHTEYLHGTPFFIIFALQTIFINIKNKTIMYALTFINEGNYNSAPYSSVIAVSEDKEKLRKKLRDCVIEDIETDDDELDESKNWSIINQYDDFAELLHTGLELYAKYNIIETEVI